MKIDRREARRIADLAHLEFDEAGLDRMAAEMSKVLEYIDQLSEVHLESSSAAGSSVPRFLGSSGEPRSLGIDRDIDDMQPEEPRNRGTEELREDTPRPSTPVDLVARNAPSFARGHFVVPKVIGGE